MFSGPVREQRSAAELCCPCSASASSTCALAGACPVLLRAGLVGTLHKGSLKQSQQQGVSAETAAAGRLTPSPCPLVSASWRNAVLCLSSSAPDRSRPPGTQILSGGSLHRGCCSEWEEPCIFQQAPVASNSQLSDEGRTLQPERAEGIIQRGACRPAVRDTEAKACLPRKEPDIAKHLGMVGNTVCPQDRNYSFIFAILLMFNF